MIVELKGDTVQTHNKQTHTVQKGSVDTPRTEPELQHQDINAADTHETENNMEKQQKKIKAAQQNAERQRRFVDRLRTPEKKSELLNHRQKINARRRELRQAKNNTKSKSRQSRKMLIAQHGLSTFDETSVKPHDVGNMAYTCSECGALMFKDEKSDQLPSGDNKSAKCSLCCSYGNIKLPPIKRN